MLLFLWNILVKNIVFESIIFNKVIVSLQKCPNCKKHISWGKVYKKINKKRFYGNHLLKCPKCKYKLGIKLKKKSILESMWKALLWMAFPILLIGLVALGNFSVLYAIILVILYHFMAMAYIISTYKYDSVKK